jgi:hypothetical protein
MKKFLKPLLLVLFITSSLFGFEFKGIENSFSKSVQQELLSKLGSSTHTSQLHKDTTYHIKKGWNEFVSPRNGIDVIESFKNISEVKFIVTYDFESHYWAGFTLDQRVLKNIKEMLLLNYLEPYTRFFILSNKELTLKVVNTKISKSCLNLFSDSNYLVLEDTGTTKEAKESQDKSISINSRYHSHEHRGNYGDTRVILFYPKVTITSHKKEQYGPGEPTVLLKYNQAYENKQFYIYDYFEKKCYKGWFPSRKRPPFPVLQILE